MVRVVVDEAATFLCLLFFAASAGEASAKVATTMLARTLSGSDDMARSSMTLRGMPFA